MSSVWGVRWGYHIGGFTPGGGSGAYSVVSTLVYAVGSSALSALNLDVVALV